MHIVSGPAEVIACGMVTGFGGAPIHWKTTFDEQPLELKMTFRSDSEVEDVAVETQWIDNGLELVLVNFDSTDGRGSAQPVLLAEQEEGLIFLHFRVFRFGKTDDRTVHYTFYKVTKEAVDWSVG